MGEESGVRFTRTHQEAHRKGAMRHLIFSHIIDSDLSLVVKLGAVMLMLEGFDRNVLALDGFIPSFCKAPVGEAPSDRCSVGS